MLALALFSVLAVIMFGLWYSLYVEAGLDARRARDRAQAVAFADFSLALHSAITDVTFAVDHDSNDFDSDGDGIIDFNSGVTPVRIAFSEEEAVIACDGGYVIYNEGSFTSPCTGGEPPTRILNIGSGIAPPPPTLAFPAPPDPSVSDTGNQLITSDEGGVFLYVLEWKDTPTGPTRTSSFSETGQVLVREERSYAPIATPTNDGYAETLTEVATFRLRAPFGSTFTPGTFFAREAVDVLAAFNNTDAAVRNSVRALPRDTRTNFNLSAQPGASALFPGTAALGRTATENLRLLRRNGGRLNFRAPNRDHDDPSYTRIGTETYDANLDSMGNLQIILTQQFVRTRTRAELGLPPVPVGDDYSTVSLPQPTTTLVGDGTTSALSLRIRNYDNPAGGTVPLASTALTLLNDPSGTTPRARLERQVGLEHLGADRFQQVRRERGVYSFSLPGAATPPNPLFAALRDLAPGETLSNLDIVGNFPSIMIDGRDRRALFAADGAFLRRSATNPGIFELVSAFTPGVPTGLVESAADLGLDGLSALATASVLSTVPPAGNLSPTPPPSRAGIDTCNPPATTPVTPRDSLLALFCTMYGVGNNTNQFGAAADLPSQDAIILRAYDRYARAIVDSRNRLPPPGSGGLTIKAWIGCRSPLALERIAHVSGRVNDGIGAIGQGCSFDGGRDVENNDLGMLLVIWLGGDSAGAFASGPVAASLREYFPSVAPNFVGVGSFGGTETSFSPVAPTGEVFRDRSGTELTPAQAAAINCLDGSGDIPGFNPFTRAPSGSGGSGISLSCEGVPETLSGGLAIGAFVLPRHPGLLYGAGSPTITVRVLAPDTLTGNRFQRITTTYTGSVAFYSVAPVLQVQVPSIAFRPPPLDAYRDSNGEVLLRGRNAIPSRIFQPRGTDRLTQTPGSRGYREFQDRRARFNRGSVNRFFSFNEDTTSLSGGSVNPCGSQRKPNNFSSTQLYGRDTPDYSGRQDFRVAVAGAALDTDGDSNFPANLTPTSANPLGTNDGYGGNREFNPSLYTHPGSARFHYETVFYDATTRTNVLQARSPNSPNGASTPPPYGPARINDVRYYCFAGAPDITDTDDFAVRPPRAPGDTSGTSFGGFSSQ